MRRNWIGIAMGTAVVAIAALVGSSALRVPADPNSITLLPLRLLGDTSLRTTADAITEEIGTAMAMDSTIRVRFGSREDESTGSLDVAPAGAARPSAFVLDGGVQRGGGRIRVTLRLLRTSDAVAVWAGSTDLEDADLSVGSQRLAAEARRAMSATRSH